MAGLIFPRERLMRTVSVGFPCRQQESMKDLIRLKKKTSWGLGQKSKR